MATMSARRSPFGALLLAVTVCVLSAGAEPADEGTGAVDDTRAVLEQWVETRRLISRERRDWALKREMLAERIELVQREIASLRAKISDAEESIAEADRKRADLIEQNAKLKDTSTALRGTVVTLEAQTAALLGRLPDPIRQHVKPLSQRLPDRPEESTLSLAERFQNVVGILNEVNKFNSEITVTTEVRPLPDGTSAEVTALYVGIGQAYYVSASGHAAGFGTASGDEWVWTPAFQEAADIARAIAILENEEVAEFVHLPVDIQ
jgi:hypothetical protein